MRNDWPEEVFDNTDYWHDIQYGGDARSDEEIKDAIYSRDFWDEDDYPDHDHFEWSYGQ